MQSRKILGLFTALVLAFSGILAAKAPAPVQAGATNIRISQVYGAGGNAGAVLKNDFVELFNPTDTAVSLVGWSIQYASAAGTSWTNKLDLSGTISPYSYFLIKLAGGTNGADLPVTADLTGSINMSGTAGKLALLNTTAVTPAVTCPPTANVIDFIGFGGTANCYEGSGPAPAPSTSLAVIRDNGGCLDNDQNNTDFITGAPSPRNSSSPIKDNCDLTGAPNVSSTIPANGTEGVSTTADVVINFNEPVNVAAGAFTISCNGSARNFTITGTSPSSIFTLNPESGFSTADVCTVTVVAAKVTDDDIKDPPDTMIADYTFSFGTAGVPPTVASTIPTNGGINVLPTDSLTVTFSEDVTTAEGWFTLDCPVGAPVTATSSGTGNTRTIDPTNRMPSSTTCTATIFADHVADVDGTVDPMAANYDWTFTTAVNTAPTVSKVTPTNNATNVSLVPNITVTFSEEVETAANWYTLQCPAPTLVESTWSGTGTTRTITPVDPLPAGTICSITIENTLITDLDINDPKQLVNDYSWGFTTTNACYTASTPIHDVQGTGDTSPLTGPVTIEGIVTADYQAEGYLGGYFVQEPEADWDADPLTSEGIFVYNYSNDVNPGDYVRVTASTVAEYMGTGSYGHMNHQTQLSTITSTLVCASGMNITPVTLNLPLPDNEDPETYLERYESMLVTIPDTLTVQQNYFQGRFGQLTLGSDGRIVNHLNDDTGATFEENLRRMIILDDGSTTQNRAPIPYYAADGALRAGDTLTDGLTGVLDQGEINSDSAPTAFFPDVYYRLHPTVAPVFNTVARPAAPPEVGGRLKVASYNVLNYFTTLDSRGADTEAEFIRQHQKLVNAICALDADVIGLIEIENNGATAVNTLLEGYATYDGLNDVANCGPYAVISDPPLGYGEDAIKTTLIYRTDVVETVGGSVSTFAAPFDDYRPPVAQTFKELSTNSVFSVVVNHFKSKNCDPVPVVGSGDEDLGVDGGCYNATRVAMANTLLGWINNTLVPVDPDVLVIGDLNAYGNEDPIQALTTGGLIDQVAAHLAPAERYSYVFDGTVGYLDHGLSTANMDAQITGIGYWHINADETLVIDYNTEFKPVDLYETHPYRSSDHDPVIIGLNLYRHIYFPVIFR